MLWFEYKKKTNIFCVATFSVALLNIVLNITFLDRYFNDTRRIISGFRIKLWTCGFMQ